MRFRRPVALFIGLVLQFALARSTHAAGSHEKQRVIVLALDCSGSMTHSDPGRRRIEAAELLLASADQGDQVGVIAFGDQLPLQLTVNTFPGIPGQMLATKIRLRLLLPIGSAALTIPDVAGIGVSPTNLNVLPNQPEHMNIFATLGSHAGDVVEVPYSVAWKSGAQSNKANAVLRVAVKRLTIVEAAKELWIWISVVGLLILLLILLVKLFAPRSLRGKLQISREGSVLYSLVMPSDLRSKTLQIKASSNALSVTRSGAIVEVPSESDGALPRQ